MALPRRALVVITFFLALVVAQVSAPVAYAAALSNLSVAPGSPLIGVATTYRVGLSNVSASTARCVTLQFATSGSGGAGSMPGGMSVASPTLTGSSSVTPGSWGTGAVVGNTVTFTYAAGEIATSGQLTLTGITNASVAGGYFLIVHTYSNLGCSTGIDQGFVQFYVTNATTVGAVVDPSLSFAIAGHSGPCNGILPSALSSASSTSMSLGSVNRDTNAVVAQDMIISTNAANGYTVFISQTSAMSDGAGHSIAGTNGTNANPAPFSAPGTEAFGYTTNDSTLGTGSPDRFTNNGPAFAALDGNGAEVAFQPTGPNLGDSNCIAYQVGVSPNTVSGNYGTTVLYSAVPSF